MNSHDIHNNSSTLLSFDTFRVAGEHNIAGSHYLTNKQQFLFSRRLLLLLLKLLDVTLQPPTYTMNDAIPVSRWPGSVCYVIGHCDTSTIKQTRNTRKRKLPKSCSANTQNNDGEQRTQNIRTGSVCFVFWVSERGNKKTWRFSKMSRPVIVTVQ